MKRKDQIVLLIIGPIISLIGYTSDFFEISQAFFNHEENGVNIYSNHDINKNELAHNKTSKNDYPDNNDGLPLGNLKNLENWPLSQIVDLCQRPMYRAHEEIALHHWQSVLLTYAQRLNVESNLDMVSFFIAFATVANAAYASTWMVSNNISNDDFSAGINMINDTLNLIKYSSPIMTAPLIRSLFSLDDEAPHSDSDTDESGNDDDDAWPSPLPLMYELQSRAANTLFAVVRRLTKGKIGKINYHVDEYHVSKIIVLSLAAEPGVMNDFLIPFYNQAHKKMQSSTMRIQAESIAHTLKHRFVAPSSHDKNPYFAALTVIIDCLGGLHQAAAARNSTQSL